MASHYVHDVTMYTPILKMVAEGYDIVGITSKLKSNLDTVK
jgi:hypothetical protein